MTQFCKVGDIEVAYDIEGEGPTLLLMHGLQGGRRMLRQLVDHLKPNFRVISYDQRDSGETRNLPTPYDLVGLANDAAQLLDALGLGEVHLMGTSFGGRVAQAFAILHPQRVDKLILSSTWPLPKSMLEVNPDGLAKFMRIRGGLPASVHELAEMFAPAAFLRDHPEVRNLLVGMPDSPERAERRAQAANTVHGDSASIAAPTLLIAGELDEMVPAKATQSMLKLIAESEFVMLPGVGHTAALQAPDELARKTRAFVLKEA